MNQTATAMPTTPGISTPGSRFARLNALGPVGLNSTACLHLHKSWVNCQRCQDTCPQSCLQVEAGGLKLDTNRCNGCGRCATACPTEALAVDGFALEEMTGARASLVCQHGGNQTDRDIAVPCMAGVSKRSLLMQLWLNPELHIDLVKSDRCATCATNAAGESPALQLEQRLQRSLVACGLPGSRVAVVSRPSLLPIGNSQRSAIDQPRPGRRSFFSSLGRAVSQAVVQKTAGASPMVDLATLPKQPRSAVPYLGGHETRLLMLHLAARAGSVPKQANLAQVSISDRCRAHGTCSRLCPTGALRSSLDRNSKALTFDAWLCIDCGACAKACPESALHYEARTWREFQNDPVLLSRVEQRECIRCGEAYSGGSNDDLCPHCSKSANLSQVGFSMFSGLRASSLHETGPP